MPDWRPGPVVVAVFMAGVIGVWVVVSLRVFYGLALDPIDVALNLAIFMTVAGWWTERQ